MTTVHIVVGASSCVSYPIDILHARVFGEDTRLDVFLWCLISSSVSRLLSLAALIQASFMLVRRILLMSTPTSFLSFRFFSDRAILCCVRR